MLDAAGCRHKNGSRGYNICATFSLGAGTTQITAPIGTFGPDRYNRLVGGWSPTDHIPTATTDYSTHNDQPAGINSMSCDAAYASVQSTLDNPTTIHKKAPMSEPTTRQRLTIQRQTYHE